MTHTAELVGELAGHYTGSLIKSAGLRGKLLGGGLAALLGALPLEHLWTRGGRPYFQPNRPPSPSYLDELLFRPLKEREASGGKPGHTYSWGGPGTPDPWGRDRIIGQGYKDPTFPGWANPNWRSHSDWRNYRSRLSEDPRTVFEQERLSRRPSELIGPPYEE